MVVIVVIAVILLLVQRRGEGSERKDANVLKAGRTYCNVPNNSVLTTPRVKACRACMLNVIAEF